MKSLFVDCHVFDGAFQGTRTYLKGLYSNLIKNNPEIHFYLAAMDVNNLKKEFGSPKNVTYLKYKFNNKYYRLGIDIPLMIRKNKIEWAHFQYMLPLIKACKEVTTIHDILFIDYPQYFSFKFRVIYNTLFRLAAKRSDVLLTVSEYSKRQIALHYNIEENKIFITPNGVKCTSDNKDVKRENFILYVSRIEHRKNHIGLLKSYIKSGLYQKGIKLMFAGYGITEFPPLSEFIQSLPSEIKDCIILCTPNNDELPILLSSCKLFVYPSYAEGFGIPPLEAALYKSPVLCSNSTAMAEFSELGFEMFNPNNEEEFSEKMKILCTSNVDNFKLEAIATKIKDKYNWDKSSRILLDSIESHEQKYP